MAKVKAVLLSSLAAVLVQPLVFCAWLGLPALVAGESAAVLADLARTSILAAVVAIPFVLLVGLPATLLLSRYGKLRWWPLALIGFLSATLPFAALGPGNGPGSSGGNWHGRFVEFVLNGEPTLFGWLAYLESLAFVGSHGLVGASVFYIVWRHCMSPNNSFKPKPLRGSA